VGSTAGWATFQVVTSGYRVEKEIARRSEPRHDPSGGFTRQLVRWNVVAPNGIVVRSFKGRNGKRRALDEIRRRGKRKAAFADAREQARASGEPVVVRTRGRSPITITFTDSSTT
jgi:hypothetical protein